MKNFIPTLVLVFLALFSSYNLSAQAVTIEWQRSLGGSWHDDAYSIQQTADGGYIVAGDSYSNDGDVTGNHGGNDYWIVKLDASANITWQRALGGSNSDGALSIQQTTDGGYIVAGYSESNDGDVTGNHGGPTDYWVVKLDASGNITWQKSLGGSNNEGAFSIQQTSDGGYIVAGNSGSNDGDITGNHGDRDYWVVKLGPDVGIQETKKLSISVYPNPTSDKLMLTCDQSAVGQAYYISDQLGKLVTKGIISASAMELDLTELNSGVYFITTDFTMPTKLIKL